MVVDTIKRLITICTEQGGYLFNAEDYLAVSRMCFGIAGIFALILLAIVIKMRNEPKREE